MQQFLYQSNVLLYSYLPQNYIYIFEMLNLNFVKVKTVQFENSIFQLVRIRKCLLLQCTKFIISVVTGRMVLCS